MTFQQQDYDASQFTQSQVVQERPLVRESSTYLTDAEAEKLCLLFADGLISGIGYAKIFDFMRRRKLDPKLVDKLQIAILEHGDQLGEAFARFGILDAPARKLILVAEEQGTMPSTFKDQAKIYGMRIKRKKLVLFSLVEPLVFLMLSLVFQKLLSNLIFIYEGDVSFAQTFYEGGLQAAILGVFCLFFAYLWYNMPVESSIREMGARIWFAIPVLSKPTRIRTIAYFCRFLRQSLNSGMDLFRSLELASEASQNPAFQATVRRAIQELERGSSLAVALEQMKGMHMDVIDHVGIGEESGRLDERLEYLVEKFEELAKEAYDRSLATRTVVFRMVFIVLIMSFAVFGGVLDFLLVNFQL